MIAIIAAMEVEMELLKENMTIEKAETISSSIFYKGNLFGKDIVLVKSGVGKVNAALCTQALIMKFAPKLIINLGVAGGIGKDIKIGDYVLATSCIQHDADVTALEKSPIGTLFTNKGNIVYIACSEKYNDIILKASSNKIHTGVVATGDQFIADREKTEFFRKEFSAVACEMELGAIAQVCYLNDTELVALKCISDNADDDGKIDFLTCAKKTAHQNADLLKDIFENANIIL